MTVTDEALARALSEHGLDERHAPDVVALLARPREEWPPCCGSFCDPCTLVLHRAADRARQLAGR